MKRSINSLALLHYLANLIEWVAGWVKGLTNFNSVDFIKVNVIMIALRSAVAQDSRPFAVLKVT